MPAEFEVWAAKMENETGSTIKADMFDNAKELVAGRMKECCEHKGTKGYGLTPWSRTHLGRVGVATNGTRAMLCDSNTLPGRGDDDLHVPAQQDADEGERWHNAL